jgi:hypothetical protein
MSGSPATTPSPIYEFKARVAESCHVKHAVAQANPPAAPPNADGAANAAQLPAKIQTQRSDMGDKVGSAPRIAKDTTF